MELLFNELSTNPLSIDSYKANDKMKQFAQAVAVARKKGFRNIRSHYASNQIELAENYSLHTWLTNREVPKDYKDVLYGMITQPFIREDDETIEYQYLEADYYFEDAEFDIPKTVCFGLSAAHLYDTLSISLASSTVWDKIKLPILIEKDGVTSLEKDGEPICVYNVSSKESFEYEEIETFIEKLGTITLIETEILPDDKKIHLADHHGKAELKAFCKKLKNSPYVIEMRSTDWGGHDFIRKIHRNGVVEIVLTDTQRKYALSVQTTGTNLRETKAIAIILEERYY
jgi:hypothetical protein